MIRPGLPGLPPPSESGASLDPQETPVESKTCSTFAVETPPSDPLRDVFRHSGWKHQRRQIYEALLRAALFPDRAQRFAACGSEFWILRHKTDSTRFKIVPDLCRDRFCVPCSAARQATIRHNLDTHLLAQPYRLLTLTIRSDGQPLSELLDRLYASFRRLRQRAIWKDRVRGGVAFLEITYNPDGGGWHPHLHCILEGLYIPRPELTKQWLSCTGDSHNLDLKLIRSRHGVLNYVTKYSMKPLPASIVGNPDALDEAIDTLSGRRLIVTFGTWRSWKLLDDASVKDWDLYCHANCLAVLLDPDDLLMANVAAMMKTADPHTGEFFATATEDP